MCHHSGIMPVLCREAGHGAARSRTLALHGRRHAGTPSQHVVEGRRQPGKLRVCAGCVRATLQPAPGHVAVADQLRHDERQARDV